MKKVLVWVAVAVLVTWVYKQPQAFAAVVHHVFAVLGTLASNL